MTTMKRFLRYALLMMVVSILAVHVFSQRFPAPEFEGDYQIPPTQIAKVKPVIFEYLDILVFYFYISVKRGTLQAL